jgi:YjbE family integral membrane protein
VGRGPNKPRLSGSLPLESSCLTICKRSLDSSLKAKARVLPSVPIPFPKCGEGVPEGPLLPWRGVGARMHGRSVNGYDNTLHFKEVIPEMDWSALACPAIGWNLCATVFSILLINIVLSGDNAVVIALAVKTLPRKMRLGGIVFGAGLAVLLRVLLTFFAAQLLLISYIKLIGGLLIFWIAVRLLIQETVGDEEGEGASSMWHAIWMIVVADVTMSTDNILALAGASKGNLFLLIFGLVLSVPIVVCASSVLARLMDRYPILVYLGAAILGKVAVELVFTDPAVVSHLFVQEASLYVLEAVGAASVLVVGRLWAGRAMALVPAEDEAVPRLPL